MPTIAKPTFGSAFDAARAAGSNKIVSHNPWQEESFQSTLVDWVVLHDISFGNAAASITRGLLTWNRADLLRALPNSRNIPPQ